MSAEEEEARFIEEARREVLSYLREGGVAFSSIPDSPDWYLAPYVSVWPVFGASAGEFPGWFAIAGDLPTDYVSSADARDARSAVRHFSRAWLSAAEDMANGERHAPFSIGEPHDWPELSKLLKARALLLREVGDNDGLWPTALPLA